MNLQPAVKQVAAGHTDRHEVRRHREGFAQRAGARAIERRYVSMKDLGGTQDTGASTEQLRADIEATRADLGDDVAALSDKVNPRARMRRAVGTARGNLASATSRAREVAPRTARQAGQSVRARPVAAGGLALAGAAVTATVLLRRRAAQARAAKRADARRWSAVAGAAATALLARRRADKAQTGRIRAAAGPWFRG